MQNSIGNGPFYYSFTSDGWTSSKNKKLHWSATTMHWIDEHWRFRRVLLDIGDLGVSATAAVISELWDTQINAWGLSKDKLVSCVVDGAANYQAASKKQVLYNIWCHCHRLHLLSKEILCHPRIYPIYQKCKKITKYLNKSRAANSLLEVQIKQPGDTRWNSSHLMFQTLIKNQEVLDRALVGSKLTGLDDAE